LVNFEVLQMNLSYKICTQNDLQDIEEISVKTFVTAFEKHNNPEDFKIYMDTAFSKEQLRRELLDDNVNFYLVYGKNDVVGYFKLNEKEAQTEPFGDTSVEIERIYVLDEYQGHNIGKQMLMKIIEIAKQRQMAFLWLGVWEMNAGAIRFYERNGFKKFDTHPYYVGNDKQTDWLMRLDFV